MTAHYDIIVIGAGPAGANFARLIDTDAYKILLLDGSEGHGPVCGGLISPDAQDIFAGYDICLPGEVLASPQLFSVRTIDLCNGQVRHYRRSYMNVDRAKFDCFLRSLVPDRVEKTSGRCKSVTKCDAGYELALVDGRRLSCTYLVGADGAGSILRKCLFPKRKLHRYLAIQQWFPAGEINPYYSCIFDNHTSEGCSWIFFKDGHMIFGGAFEKQGGREAFEEQKRKLIAGGFVPPKGFDCVERTEACLVARPHLGSGIFRGMDGAFLIGEAAGLISPSSFEGISYALCSGEALADAFGQAKKDPHRILVAYKRRTAKSVLKVKLRCLKRPFMYNRILRSWIMKSGLTAIKVRER